MNKSGRIEWVDYAKGITILLVIVGHTCGGVLRGAIYSFHMPLFFILSCFTYKYSKSWIEVRAKAKKSFKHLIIPGLFVFFVDSVFHFFQNGVYFTKELVATFLENRFLALFFFSGWEVNMGGGSNP